MAHSPVTKQQRQAANFQPSSWSYDFMESIADQNNHLIEVEEENVKKMEVEIRRMLDHNEGDVEALTLLELVNDIDHLGLGYKFEESINRALERVESSQIVINNDLHASALYFRLLRQHGHYISTDIFERFKDSNKKFMASLSKDSRGMLSLYEASYLGFDGEKILDEAREFTSFHLNNIINKADVENKLYERVRHALELPFHHRMPRLEARWNIEMYDQFHNQNLTNQLLHKLAILDFNKVQFLHQLELQEVSRWWRHVGLANKLSFARDRIMECFFATVGIIFEPKFSKCRIGLTKVLKLISVLDDIYDVYGYVEELERLTDLVHKWDVNDVDQLPDYMKQYFLALNNTVNDLACHTPKEQHQVIISQLRKEWADLCKAFLREAKWSCNNHIPKLGDYLHNGWISSSGVVILTHASYFFNEEPNQTFIHCNALLRFPAMIFRLANDLCSTQKDIEGGEVAKAVPCYMHETGLSDEDARVYIRELIDHNWKMMNKEICQNSIFDKHFIQTCCNLARIAMCQYQDGVDAHTTPNAASTNRVNSVLIHSIQLANSKSRDA